MVYLNLSDVVFRCYYVLEVGSTRELVKSVICLTVFFIEVGSYIALLVLNLVCNKE